MEKARPEALGLVRTASVTWKRSTAAVCIAGGVCFWFPKILASHGFRVCLDDVYPHHVMPGLILGVAYHDGLIFLPVCGMVVEALLTGTTWERSTE